ncbi:MAG: 16S rRNA (uracil(1498)-N(3))-methyltransferase [Lachnospiraceae bacterium]|nr:16S rRNA (uracil(1498)-N(3))-methyltransferase [Lachnospiraceae bacterium]
MYHFYTERSNILEDHIVLDGPDVNHIRNVLRMKDGEELIICDGEGMDHYCRIRCNEGRKLIADIVKSCGSAAEPSAGIVLFQGLPKKDKMELIIQKSVELGVKLIVPVMTKRVIVKTGSDEKGARKLERWQSIAKSAAEQSGRGIIPEVHETVSFETALKMASELECSLIPYENADNSDAGMEEARNIIRSLRGKKSIGVFIGPEGGFEPEEAEKAIDSGCKAISLGRRILRTETAGLAALAIIGFELD